MSFAVLLLLLSVIGDVAGQVCFKRGLGNEHAAGPVGLLAMLGEVLRSPWILAGIGVYVAEFILWFAALSLAPLSFVVPFGALSYCGVVLASRYLLHEPVSPRRWLGTAIVAAGVALVCLPGQ